jgi:HNH endonuclease
MRELDIKLLWGRSGNRCAICKMELSPTGDKYTLGEMAHIVARSFDGPRGDKDLPLDERDNYSNLILLCPNHHSEIDKDPDVWSRSKLLARKSKHEKWVSRQLDQRRIAVLPVENADFLRERESTWQEFSAGRVWAVTAITPLSICGEVIDPLSDGFRKFYDGLLVPCFPNGAEPANRTFTRPSAHGLVNEDLRNLTDGNGHRIEVFRSGHCEYLVCLQASVDQITQVAKDRRGGSLEADKVIRYTDLADTIKTQLETLSALWKKCLPFRDMTLSWMLINTSTSIMYSRETDFTGPVFGFPVTAPQLLYREVINVDDHPVLLKRTLNRAVNGFGLVLDNLFEANGTWLRPKRMI